MSGTVTQVRQSMSYQEFVWFILSEEDKGTSTAAEFWFRIMDRDGDGLITLEDLEFFYKEQVKYLLDGHGRAILYGRSASAHPWFSQVL